MAEKTQQENQEKTSVLNPKLEVAVYTFADDRTFRAGVPVPLSDAEHAEYSEEKHEGKQVVVRT